MEGENTDDRNGRQPAVGERLGHDQLFKQLLQAFFADFMRLFDPRTAAGLDLDTVTFRDAEMFTDIPQGERRTADLVAQVRTLIGTPELILVHTEIQREREAEFPRRMWQYYAGLRLREGLPVVPVALVLYPAATEEGVSLAVYEEEVLGRTYLTFRYLQISTPLLDAEQYVEAESPLGAALAAVMRPPAGGRAAQVDLYLACLRRIRRAQEAGEVDEARSLLLVNMVATYLVLTDEERDTLRARLAREGEGTMEATELTWADRLLMQGRAEGRAEGQRALIRDVALARFGAVPARLEERLAATSTEDELRTLALLVATAATPAALGSG